MQFLKSEPDPKGISKSDMILTVFVPSFFGFGAGERKQFAGNCTVWHELPHMRRPGTMAEVELNEFWEIERRNNPIYKTT